MYEYFISYNYTIQQNFGFGNVKVKCSKEIKTIEDLREIEDSLMKKNKSSTVVILNYILLNRGVVK